MNELKRINERAMRIRNLDEEFYEKFVRPDSRQEPEERSEERVEKVGIPPIMWFKQTYE